MTETQDEKNQCCNRDDLFLPRRAPLAAAPLLMSTQTVDIDASADKVWNAVEELRWLNTWHPAVAKDEIVEGKNNTVGAVRLLTLKGGGPSRRSCCAFEPPGRSIPIRDPRKRAAGERLHLDLDREIRGQGQVDRHLDGPFQAQERGRQSGRQRERQDRDRHHHGRLPRRTLTNLEEDAGGRDAWQAGLPREPPPRRS